MANKPQIEILACSDEDIPRCVEIVSESFGHDAPFVDAYFPHHETKAGQAEICRRLLEIKHSPEDSTFLKAVIRSAAGRDEEIIGFAIWTHMTEAPSRKLDEVEDTQKGWPDEQEREHIRRLWKDYVVPRGRAVEESGGAGVYVLELLAVHPDHQRKGAGVALTKWGTTEADKKGLESVVEGTPPGFRTYYGCGFRTEIEEMHFDVGPEFSHKEKPVLLFMKRAAKK